MKKKLPSSHANRIRPHVITAAIVCVVYVVLVILLFVTNKSYGYTSRIVLDTSIGGTRTQPFVLGPAGTTARQLIPSIDTQPQELDIYANPEMEYTRGMIYFTLYDEENQVLMSRQISIEDHNGNDWVYKISFSTLDGTDLSGRPLFFTISTTADSPYEPLLCAVAQEGSDAFASMQTLTMNDQMEDFCIFYRVRGVAQVNSLAWVKIRLLTCVVLILMGSLVWFWHTAPAERRGGGAGLAGFAAATNDISAFSEKQAGQRRRIVEADSQPWRQANPAVSRSAEPTASRNVHPSSSQQTDPSVSRTAVHKTRQAADPAASRTAVHKAMPAADPDDELDDLLDSFYETYERNEGTDDFE